jgi:hypothetical protein
MRDDHFIPVWAAVTFVVGFILAVTTVAVWATLLD